MVWMLDKSIGDIDGARILLCLKLGSLAYCFQCPLLMFTGQLAGDCVQVPG